MFSYWFPYWHFTVSKEIDKHFDFNEFIAAFILFILLPFFISIFAVGKDLLILLVDRFSFSITRLLYKIANIVINKDDHYKTGISDGYVVIPEIEHSAILDRLDGKIFPAIPILAPMAARVYEIKVKVDQPVKKNDIIIIVETLKMEIPIVAPEDGTVATIEVAVDDLVETGDLLATLF